MASNLTLIIDCHAICHAAKHTMGDLSYEEQKVGIIFGFLKQLLSLAKRFETNSFLFCWDSKKSYRRNIYPNYKNRPQRSEEEYRFDKFAFKQFIELRMWTLPKFGFKNNFIQTGLEADDIIAAITQNYDREFVIISGDNDLYQLLSPNVSMYSTKSKKLTTHESFTGKWGVSPSEWVMVKQIAGCRSDTVEGVVGVAEKTAIKYLTGKLGKETKTYAIIGNSKDIIERNKQLVKLPFNGTKIPKIYDNEIFNFADFTEIVNKYGFYSFQQTEAANSWIYYFKME